MGRTIAIAAGSLVVALAGSAAAQATTCVQGVRWEGDDVVTAAVRRALEEGPLGAAPASACAGVTVRVERVPPGIDVRLRIGERAVSHTLTDAGALPSWLESWLEPALATPPGAGPASPEAAAPETAAPPAAPTATQATGSPRAGPRPAARETERAARSTAPPAGSGGPRDVDAARSVPVLVALRVGGELDFLAPAWASAELELAIALGSWLWVGLTAGGAFSPEQADTTRLALRMAGRAGWFHRFASGLLRLGGALGIVSGSARRELVVDGAEVAATDEEARPYVELGAGYELSLGGRWALSLGLAGRVNVPDALLEGGDTQDEPPDPLPRPAPLPDAAVMLVVGLSLDAGGAW